MLSLILKLRRVFVTGDLLVSRPVSGLALPGSGMINVVTVVI